MGSQSLNGLKHEGSLAILLLPSRSGQHDVLLFGSIQEGILQARH